MTKVSKTISFGKIDGYGNGRKSCEATVEVTLRYAGSAKLTVDGEWQSCNEFAAVGAIWNSSHTHWLTGGQMLDSMRDEYGLRDPRFLRIVEIWERYHLNNLKAGTREQMAILKAAETSENLKERRINHYGWACRTLEAQGKLTASLGKVINANGLEVEREYTYGSAWLCDPLPVEIEREIEELIN